MNPSESNKILWVDVETTGLIPGRAGIIQLAAMVEIGGKVLETIDLKMRPLVKNVCDPEALKLHGLSEPAIKLYPPNSDAFTSFEALLRKYIDKFDKLDKFILAGYNVNSFDEPFLRQFFVDNAKTEKQREAQGYFGSYFAWPKRDIQTYVAEHFAEYALRLKNYQLATVCEHFGIEINAHDALSDITATRTLYYILRYSLTAQPVV